MCRHVAVFCCCVGCFALVFADSLLLSMHRCCTLLLFAAFVAAFSLLLQLLLLQLLLVLLVLPLLLCSLLLLLRCCCLCCCFCLCVHVSVPAAAVASLPSCPSPTVCRYLLPKLCSCASRQVHGRTHEYCEHPRKSHVAMLLLLCGCCVAAAFAAALATA